jgi:hypothetical protein
MSVPLDRLYHYLDDCVNHDLLIYRWAPHGSRKLDDLKKVREYTQLQCFDLPQMICHDQEPLDFDFYPRLQIKSHAKHMYLENNLTMLSTDPILEYCAELHLRGAVNAMNQFDCTLLLHSEQNSLEVARFAQAGFVPVYYWSHGLIAQDWFRYAQHDPVLTSGFKKIQQDFLIYNRAWAGTREYRLYFVEQLLANQLDKNCKISFNPEDGEHYSTHQFVNPDFQIVNYNLHDELELNTHASTASADYCGKDYATTGIEIVLETLFDDHRWHLTEKSLRPIACGQPFLLMSTPGSLQYLRQYGFETFDGLIDETYDCVYNAQERLQAVIKEMKRISSLSCADKIELFGKLQKIAGRNQRHFFNGFFDQVCKEYTHNMTQAMKTMQQHCTGKHNHAIRSMIQ